MHRYTMYLKERDYVDSGPVAGVPMSFTVLKRGPVPHECDVLSEGSQARASALALPIGSKIMCNECRQRYLVSSRLTVFGIKVQPVRTLVPYSLIDRLWRV